MALRAVVFDVFETLVANGPDLWLESFRRISQSQGLQVDPQTLWDPWIHLEREFRRRRLDPETMRLNEPFQSYEEVWIDCFHRTFQNLGLSGDAAAAAKLCIGDLGHRPPFSDTLEVLERLGGTVRLGVLSNADSSFLYPLLEHYGISKKFSAVLCSEEARAYKPHPSLFQRVLEQMDVAPSEALYVGDTFQEDVRGAKLVGMRAAWINRAGLAPDPALPQADYEIQALGELLNIVEIYA